MHDREVRARQLTVSKAQASLAGRCRLRLILMGLLGAALAEGRAAIPHDKVHPASVADVVGPVALTAQVHDATADLMRVFQLEDPVILFRHHSTKREARCGEARLPQTHVKGDVAVICMHVQSEVFSGLEEEAGSR